MYTYTATSCEFKQLILKIMTATLHTNIQILRSALRTKNPKKISFDFSDKSSILSILVPTGNIQIHLQSNIRRWAGISIFMWKSSAKIRRYSCTTGQYRIREYCKKMCFMQGYFIGAFMSL